MAIPISGFGFQGQLLASVTYPIGISLTQFADDSDPFDIPSVKVAEAPMGLNGDLLPFSRANPIVISLAMVPGGSDDRSLAILLEANMPSRGKQLARDIITLIGIYGDGRIVTLNNGVITDGMPGFSVASAGRYKSKIYTFSFEKVITG